MMNKHTHLLPILLGWMVVGCTAGEMTTPQPPSPAVEPVPVMAEEIAAASPGGGLAVEGVVAAPVAPPPPPRPDPQAILGLAPATVQALLGAPSLVRNDGNAQIHQFSGPTCIFDVVFYEPVPGAAFEARHVEARARDGARADAVICLQAFLPDGLWPEGSGLATLVDRNQP